MTLAYLTLWTIGVSSLVTGIGRCRFNDCLTEPDVGSIDQVTDPFNMFPAVTNNPVPDQPAPAVFKVDPLENEVNSVDGQLNPEKIEANQVTSTANPVEVHVNVVNGPGDPESPEINITNAQADPAIDLIDKPSTSQEFSSETPILSHLITDFGLTMSKKIHQLGENETVLFSPLSIFTLLNLLMGGMGEQSKTYLETFELLGYKYAPAIIDDEAIHQLYQKLLADLSIENDHISFKMGIQNFLQKYEGNTTNILRSFTKMTNENYNAGVKELDFYGDPIGAATIINDWVNNTTEGKIPKLLTDPLSPQTKFMAVNTVYFKAPWKIPFSTGDTTVLTFDTGSEKLEIPFMSKIINVKYFSEISETFKASMVELPYRGDRYSMFIIKPNEPASLESVIQLENKLSADAINILVSSIKNLPSLPVWIDIPRMRLRYRTYLKDILEEMGASSMFSINSADFSRITTSNQTILDNMIHEAVMDITEEGTEAAAATSTVHNRHGTSLSFVLDQPSLLFIYDSKTKVPIFWARLVTPESI